MIVSRRWLEALLGRSLQGQDVADRLARQVAPVDGVVAIHQDLREVLVARVLEVRQHPNADRLSLCLVDAGGSAPLEVVCGAPNVQAGKSYPFAPVGATLPGGLKLERRKIRGVESNGMLCSAKELGLGVDQAGILELDTKAAPGTPFLEAIPVGDEQIVIDVSANRPDLLCHKGVAREVAVSLGATVKLPEMPGGLAVRRLGGLKHASPTAQPPTRLTAKVDSVEVRLEDPEGAPRYMIAVIRGVKVGPSPAWLAARLQSIGQRSINNIVDATNYILFEINQPLHAFDLAKLRGPAVVVRRARPGEPIVTLDGIMRKLTAEMTAICDGERPQIVAGVMGSAESEVTESTADIVLEAAYFQPTRIRRTRRALGLASESSYRFERGIDMLGMPDALTRAIDLIHAVADAPGEVTLRRIRDQLVRSGGGLLEVRTLPLGPADRPEAVAIQNPLSADEGYLRSRLFPGLIRRVEYNWSQGRRDIRLFEVGTVFRAGKGPRPEEELHLSVVLTGARHPTHWSASLEGVKLPDMDIWDLKRHFELAVGVAAPSCDVQPAANGSGWIAVEKGGGEPVGRAQPLEADAPRWAGPLFGLEVRIAVEPSRVVRYQPLPTQPPVVRDLSLAVPGGVTAATIEALLAREGGTLLERLDVLDEDRWEGLPAGTRGVTWRCTFRDPARTLTEREIDALLSRMLKALEEQFGVRRRQATH